MSRPILVRELTQTGFACPTQWRGTTHDGANLYVRFRFGMLTVMVGDEIVYDWFGADEWNGVMSFGQLRNLTRHLIVWPDEDAVRGEHDFDNYEDYDV